MLVSQRVRFTGNTRMHAEVNENAKLDFIDIDDSQTANIDLGGSRQSFGPVSLHYTGLHRTRVKMPGRSYDAGRGAVDIAFTERGVTFGKSQLGQDAAAIASSLDKAFATLVDKEITNFQNLETGWNVPNACVKLQFDPTSLTRTLHRHQRGTCRRRPSPSRAAELIRPVGRQRATERQVHPGPRDGAARSSPTTSPTPARTSSSSSRST